MASLAIGIDLGGTDIKAGVVDEQGMVIGRWRISTDAAAGPQAVLARMVELARAILASDEVKAHGGRIEGIGVGSPGPLDPDLGIVTRAPNLPGFVNVHVTRYFEERIDLPARLDNDANLCALGEYAFGAGREPVNGKPVRILAAYTLGTGVGGGIVIDGKVLHGASGFAAELGHMTVVPGGWQCGCGNQGCVEAYASATGMVRMARERIANGSPSRLTSIPIDQLTSRDIAEAASAGDALAREVIWDAAGKLGTAVANVVVTLNPHMVVIGGGAAAMGDLLLVPLRQVVATRAAIIGQVPTVIAPARLGNDAGFIGAAAMFHLAAN